MSERGWVTFYRHWWIFTIELANAHTFAVARLGIGRLDISLCWHRPSDMESLP